jgi:hypothetical protein
MLRRLLIALGALGWAAPAGGETQGFSNPLAVTWDVGAPSAIRPLSLSLDDRADFEIGRVPIRVPDALSWARGAVYGDSWEDSWSDGSRFRICALDDRACADELPGRFGLRFQSDGTGGVRFGALVRLGENLQRPRATSRNAWRFFIAADAHALTWDFNGNDDETLKLEDQIMLGDAQVGLARRLGPGELALGFIHREVQTEGASRTEQFGGVTFTMEH